jgi:hypothetical protein
MDNYFHQCPPMMDDGRLFTDYRSSQVREEIFRYKNCVVSENEARTLRMDNGSQILDDEWNLDRATRSCMPEKKCFHKYPITRVTTEYNNAELLAYNGEIVAPSCDNDCFDYRATVTPGSIKGRPKCFNVKDNNYKVFFDETCPKRCTKSNRLLPEALYVIDGSY